MLVGQHFMPKKTMIITKIIIFTYQTTWPKHCSCNWLILWFSTFVPNHSCTQEESSMNMMNQCCTGRLCTSIWWKSNFKFTIKKIHFFQPIRNFPLQSFWELIRPKHNCKTVNESSEKSVDSETSGSSPIAFRQELWCITNQVCIPTLDWDG